MKITDYCPRAAPFDSYLKGRDLVGVEVGVDVGAHAEALLTYCPIALLALIDPWPNPYCRGFCEGRLARFRDRFTMCQGDSITQASIVRRSQETVDKLDFVYIDQIHEGPSVTADLIAWWPLVRTGGWLGYRNYTAIGTPLDKAVDAFVAKHSIAAHVESGEIVLVKS